MQQHEMNELIDSVFVNKKAEYIGNNVIAFEREETGVERQLALDDWYQGIVDNIELIETSCEGDEFHKQEAINRVQMLLKVLTGKFYE